MIAVAVLFWAVAFHRLGVFANAEESAYFALVSFTTLGFGDIPAACGMAAAWRDCGSQRAVAVRPAHGNSRRDHSWHPAQSAKPEVTWHRPQSDGRETVRRG